MDIERINENTVKFYISYVDIEERGFDREEIWYNRERSEELFWEMMDEIHQEEDFLIDGPLWIQVQALDKGLEVLVTKAQISKDGQKFELPIPDGKFKEPSQEYKIGDFFADHFGITSAALPEYKSNLDFLIAFNDFEDIISLAKEKALDSLNTKLYHFENRYYLYVVFPEDQYTEEEIDNYLSILLEYGNETQVTIHRVEEYGKEIFSENVFEQVRKYFQ